MNTSFLASRPLASRAVSLIAGAALVTSSLLPLAARAASVTTLQDTPLVIAGQTLTIAAGSQYDALTTSDTSVTVTVADGTAFIVRSPGGSPRTLENDGLLPACHVLTTGDNQLTIDGPRTVTVTPGMAGCDTSNRSDDKTPFLSLIAPNGGETYKAGDTVQVFWSNVGSSVPSVRLRLSTDGGQTWPVTLADGVINNGFYSWVVADMVTTTHARLRLDGSDQGNIKTFDLSNGDFTVNGSAAPSGGDMTPPSVPTVSGFAPYDPEAQIAAAATIDIDRGFPVVTPPSGTVTCVAGTRIKSASSSAVYYCGQDHKRHAFPNQRIHDSWYSGFAGVVTLSVDQMAAIPLGANVTYRPGTRMIKLQTDPKTYAVAADGTLRWVQDEWTAKRLYGDSWNTKIDDVSDAFFTDYKVGDPVPSGS